MNKKRIVVSLPDDQLRPLLTSVSDSIELVEWAMSGPAPREEIDIAVLPLSHPHSIFPWLEGAATGLIQSQSNGYDGIKEVLPKGRTFANATSVHETATAELAVTLALAAQRAIPTFVRASLSGRWMPRVTSTLADSKVVLIGYGGVGRAIESRLIPFEVSITRVARTARADEKGFIYGLDDLPRFLADADIVILALPLTEASRRLVDDDFLSSMRDGALIVNVGRGPLVDTNALLAHARAGRIRAALDVTDPEPLPDGHPLFATSGILVTPHVGGGLTTAAAPRMARLLREQIGRASRGQEPLNVVLRS